MARSLVSALDRHLHLTAVTSGLRSGEQFEALQSVPAVVREVPMQVAPDFDSSEWSKLQLDDPMSKDWGKAVSVFRARIYSRFIDAADVLVCLDEKKPIKERRFGFAILAIDCAVVETIGAFQEGLTDTDRKSKGTFAKFLSTSPGFQKHFTLARAKKFYSDFRCGILHQAETGGESKV
jgi:hypothetical protein